MLLTRKQQHHYALSVTLTGLMFIVYIFSYVYTFEPSAVDPNVVPNMLTDGIIPSSTDTYIIQREDGSYDMYYNGHYFETLHNLYGYYKDIPIYTSEDLVPK